MSYILNNKDLNTLKEEDILKIKNLSLRRCSDNNNILEKLINLEKLDIWNCDKINKIPNTLINLKSLIISFGNIKEIPDNFDKLEFLKINNCDNIFIPNKYNHLL